MEKKLARWLLILAFLGFLVGETRSAEKSRPPNVILVLVDDLGMTDLSCYGSKFYETPHIDQLAKEGVRFTQAYSACTVCSPTRAALMTGKYPARLHLTDWIPGHDYSKAKLRPPDWQKSLPLSEVTLAEQLKSAGYATMSIGKWHLTPDLPKGDQAYYPDQQGFDRNLGGYSAGKPPSYFSPYQIPTLEDGSTGEYLTDREASEAVRFMERNQNSPFFLYLAHYAVHQPIQGKMEVVAKYKAKDKAGGKQSDPGYAAMVESVDDAMGTIRDALKRLKLEGNTIVIFTSDNGGLVGPTDNSPLRAGKGSAYEGGVRVPLIVLWPGKTPAGQVESDPVITMDLYPTILEMTGIRALPSVVDGMSLVGLLKSGEKLKRDALFWHYPHYHPGGATPHSAIRSGDYRLVHFYEDGHDELYRVTTDPGERKDRMSSEPEKAKELRNRLEAWLKSVDAQFPVPNR